MGKYFGTDGFRGEANVDLTVEHAYKVGRFLGWYYGQKAKGERCRIVIGKDTRRSSYMFEYALVSGLTASGADAYLLHVTTTPSVSHVIRTEDFDCGIMISASHNPYYDNFAAGRNRYIGYRISLATRSFQGKKVGLDCANGSASSVAKSVFDALGADTYVINNEPDGLNINTDCGSTHIEGLQLYVREHHLDVGFAFDGDADRCLAVDERGQVLNGDKIMYICAKHFKERGQLPSNTLVTTVMSNFGLYKALDKAGIRYEKTAVGDRYVYENMKENDFMIGGEQSGHIIFRKYAHTGDGLITALMLMQVMIDTQLPLSVLAAGVTMYPQVLKNVRVDDKDLTLADAAVQAAVDECTAELGDSGRVLLRKSGTEPVLRVMAEAGTAEECEKQVDRIIAAMEKSGHLIEVKK